MKELIEVKIDTELTVKIINGDTSDMQVIMGGDDRNLTWDEYLSEYKDKYKPHVLLTREAIIKMGWVGCKANEICNDHYFAFSDGSNWGFTWRGWGDLMQAIVNKKEGYMAYYM